MLWMPSLLEPRHRLLHLRASLEKESIQPRYPPMDVGSSLNPEQCVIKKGRPHGHRYGKTEEQTQHHIAHNLRKRCIRRGFERIHDRFQKDSIFRESQISIDRTDEVCIQVDKDAQTDFTNRMTEDEYFRYKKNWWISLNKSGKNRTDERSFWLQLSVD